MCQTLFFFVFFSWRKLCLIFSVKILAWCSTSCRRQWPSSMCRADMWENNVIFMCRKNMISGMSQIRTEACGVLAGGNHLSSRSRFLAGALTLNIIKHSPRNSFATAQNSFSWASFATLFEIQSRTTLIIFDLHVACTSHVHVAGRALSPSARWHSWRDRGIVCIS